VRGGGSEWRRGFRNMNLSAPGSAHGSEKNHYRLAIVTCADDDFDINPKSMVRPESGIFRRVDRVRAKCEHDRASSARWFQPRTERQLG